MNIQDLDGIQLNPFIFITGAGTMRYQNGNQTLDAVLTSDSNGNMDWTPNYHPSIPNAGGSNNSGLTFIQDVTVDSNGHLTNRGTATITPSNGLDNTGTTIFVDYDGSSPNNLMTGTHLSQIGGTLATTDIILVADASNNNDIGWATVSQLPSSGGGTPGGSNTHIQYNSGGSFAGNASFVYNGSTQVTLTNASGTEIQALTTAASGQDSGFRARGARTTGQTTQIAYVAFDNQSFNDADKEGAVIGIQNSNTTNSSGFDQVDFTIWLSDGAATPTRTERFRFTESGQFRIWDADQSHYLAIGTAGLTANRTLTFPNSNGSNGQVLTTNGAGILSWSTAGGGSGAVGPGTVDRIAKFTTTTTVDDSKIIDDGATIQIIDKTTSAPRAYRDHEIIYAAGAGAQVGWQTVVGTYISDGEPDNGPTTITLKDQAAATNGFRVTDAAKQTCTICYTILVAATQTDNGGASDLGGAGWRVEGAVYTNGSVVTNLGNTVTKLGWHNISNGTNDQTSFAVDISGDYLRMRYTTGGGSPTIQNYVHATIWTSEVTKET